MHSQHTLLIVDDEPNVLKSLKRLLIDTGYRILTAESGEKGLEVLTENDIQVVISDYRMPGMAGVEFLNEVKKKYPDTIRMILSGYADVAAVVEAINEGHIYKFIAKPWNDQEIMTTIIRAFEQYQLQTENARLYAELQNRNRELEELTKSLEDKVVERTRDLEMKNRALTMAHSIMNLLPVGVLGLDNEFIVAYMNESLRHFIHPPRRAELRLGQGFKDPADGKIETPMKEALVKQKTVRSNIDDKRGIDLICTPLPDRAGVIGTFYWQGDQPDEPEPDVAPKKQGEPIAE